jgi:hypothetical protein
MITLTLTEQEGARMVKFPIPWDEVTLGQYAKMQGKSLLEQAAILAGVEVGEINALEDADKAILLMVMDDMGEIPQRELTGFPANIGLESIGRFELAKKFIEQFRDDDNEDTLLWDVAPYILAIYLLATEEEIKTGFYAGFPVAKVQQAMAIPITQAITAIVFFSANCPGFQKLLPLCCPENRKQTKRRRELIGLISMVSSLQSCQSARASLGSTINYLERLQKSIT